LKAKFTFPFFSVIILSIVYSSCSIQKRNYRDGYFIDWHASSANKTNTLAIENNSENNIETIGQSLESEVQAKLLNSVDGFEKAYLPKPINNIGDSKTFNHSRESLLTDLKTSSVSRNSVSELDCDVIVLRNGDEINAKVIEVTPTEIKYKKCVEGNSVIYTKLKSDVFQIKYADGSKDFMGNEKSASEVSDENKKTHWAAITGMVSGILGVLFSGFFGICGIVFSAIALSQISRKKRFKGKKMAVAGLVLGIIAIGVGVLRGFLLFSLLF
jgi:hypothetical protein